LGIWKVRKTLLVSTIILVAAMLYIGSVAPAAMADHFSQKKCDKFIKKAYKKNYKRKIHTRKTREQNSSLCKY